jgi:hypothetical protein
MLHRKFSLGLAGFSVLSIICLLALNSQSITRARSVIAPTLTVETMTSAPVEIIDISFKGSSIKDRMRSSLKQSVVEHQEITLENGDDWINNLQVDVRNISDKEIRSVSIEMIAEHPSLEHPSLVRFISAEKQSVLKPYMLSSMKADEGSFTYMNNLLKSQNSQAVYTKALLRIGRVFFTDNTMWYLGQYMIPDPNSSDRWIVAPQTEQKKIGLRYDHADPVISQKAVFNLSPNTSFTSKNASMFQTTRCGNPSFSQRKTCFFSTNRCGESACFSFDDFLSGAGLYDLRQVSDQCTDQSVRCSFGSRCPNGIGVLSQVAVFNSLCGITIK